MVEERTKISVRDHVGFGVIARSALKYLINYYGCVLVGEMNSINKRHGRGIEIYPNGYIYIG